LLISWVALLGEGPRQTCPFHWISGLGVFEDFFAYQLFDFSEIFFFPCLAVAVKIATNRNIRENFVGSKNIKFYSSEMLDSLLIN
jgi:hypothetical protein